MSSVFTQLVATTDTYGYRHLTWSLKPGVDYPQDAVLSVEYARAGQDDWTQLATNLQQVCTWIDYDKRNYDKVTNDYYRLKLSSVSDGFTYYSQAESADSSLVYPQQSYARNMIRLAQKQIQLTGRAGVLLKKKTWGQRCPYCTDFANDDPINEHCHYCLGTGILGGYYPGIPMGLLDKSDQQQYRIGQDGMQQTMIMNAKCVAWPWIHLGDVWVDSNTNQRFYIMQASVASRYRSIPIMYSLQLNTIELTDVLHSQKSSQLLSKPNTTEFVQTNTNWDKNYE